MLETLAALQSLVEGKTVAVVGNAPIVLERSDGDEIDGADVVVRFNAGVPSGDVKRDSTGTRTDVLCVGNMNATVLALRMSAPRLVLWMKTHKRFADRLLAKVNDTPLVYWPEEYEAESPKVGPRGPSSGLRLAWALSNRLGARSVQVYGMTFFDGGKENNSWWHTKRPGGRYTPSKDVPCWHDGDGERAALRALGFEDIGEGRHQWVSRNSTSRA